MRVVLAADFYPPAPGGLEAHVRRLARALVRSGHEVTVLAGGAGQRYSAGQRHPDMDTGDGVPVFRTRLDLDRVPLAYREAGRSFHPPWPDRTFTRALRGLLERVDPDVVHAHGWCEFSAVAAAGGRWPVVVTLHDHGLRCPKKNLLRGGGECARGRGWHCLTCPGPEQGSAKRVVLGAALGLTAPRLHAGVARYIAVSRHVARRHHDNDPWSDRVEVIPNFIDGPSAPFTEPDGDQVLYIGPADRHKGLAVLLAAWRGLSARPERLVVVGADETDIVASRVPARVEFTGRLVGDRVWQALRAATLLVVPSVWPEPCPTVVLEGLAAGRPVVASRVGGIPDLVVDGETGVLVPAGDPRALAGAIAAVLSDRDRLTAMAKAARQSAEAFTTNAVVPRIVAVYAAATGRRDR
jgi:glycosyltransferase involved in cell wall biosynthesis